MSRNICNECHERVEVENHYTSPGWMGTNYDEVLVVEVECPNGHGRGKLNSYDGERETRTGVLAPPAEPAEVRR